MNIPGLGLEVAAQTAAVAPGGIRKIKLEPFWEWRFEVGFSFSSEVKVKLVSGTAEKDGTELALEKTYQFTGTKSKILTLQGCELEVEGSPDDDFVAEFANPADSPMNAYLNLHYKLSALRARAAAAASQGAATTVPTEGPRVMVCGPPGSGKSSVARTLTSYATKMGDQPLVVNADPKDGMLALPGAVGASVFASILDAEAIDGWGTTPTSGPSQVPVKLPLAFYYGRARPDEDPDRYREMISKLAGSASSRFAQDPAVKSSGMIIDTPSLDEKNKAAMDNIVHVADELTVNIIVVLGSSRITSELSRRLSTQRTSLGEDITIVQLDKSEGVATRDENFIQQQCEASIKEYFFGNVGHTLSPATQQVDFDSLVIYRLGESSFLAPLQASFYSTAGEVATQTEPTAAMAHYTLAIMYASLKDPPEVVAAANIMGYVYVADVDKERRKVKILAPVSGRVGDRPLLWGSWPEPFVNLLG